MTEIERQNPEIRTLLSAAKRPFNINASSWEKEAPLLTLLHFADLHSDAENLKRIVEFMNGLKDQFEDAVCSGDMVRKYYHTGYGFWHESGADPILVTVGNHDALNNPHYDWNDLIPEAQQAATFIEPYVPFWGDVEYTPGTTYYCKRYEAQKVDLITLNTQLFESEKGPEEAFLKEKLDRALREDRGVVILLHDTSSAKQTVVPCHYSSLDGAPSEPCGPGLKKSTQKAVQDFIDAGGDFLCYLAGHSHRDFLCYDPAFPRQYSLLAPAASLEKGLRQGDSARVRGEKSQDALQFVVFDRRSKLVKVIRVGADRDHYLRSRRILVFRYTTGEIVYEE
ncbi:MAG: metallophosphoesterase [Lachnospiraceae bacterium]|nr:metallophosphoesterase [Lachnospiraceae bacterium]